MRSALTLLLALVLLAGAPRHVAWADNFGAGFQDLKLTDPVQGGPMPVVFYPTRVATAALFWQPALRPSATTRPASTAPRVHARLNAEMIEFFRRTLTPK